MVQQSTYISYSTVNPKILEENRRIMVAKEIILVLKDCLKGKNLEKMNLLDVGCSSGVITAYLAQHFASAVGIDIDRRAISLAKKKFSNYNLKFYEMDMVQNTFFADHFDVVICNQVYFLEKRQEAFFQQLYRVLKPNGICYITGGNKYFNFKQEGNYPTSYLSFWELKKLCTAFIIYRYTPVILHNPSRYGFYDMAKGEVIFKRIPVVLWRFLEPVLSNFIWILQKPA